MQDTTIIKLSQPHQITTAFHSFLIDRFQFNALYILRAKQRKHQLWNEQVNANIINLCINTK